MADRLNIVDRMLLLAERQGQSWVEVANRVQWNESQGTATITNPAQLANFRISDVTKKLAVLGITMVTNADGSLTFTLPASTP